MWLVSNGGLSTNMAVNSPFMLIMTHVHLLRLSCTFDMLKETQARSQKHSPASLTLQHQSVCTQTNSNYLTRKSPKFPMSF